MTISIAMPEFSERGHPDVDEVVSRFARPALALARRILRDDVLAEDVVQEVFTAYWRRPTAFDAGRGSLASWILAMVHHKAVDTVRQQEGRHRVFERLRDGQAVPTGQGVEDLVDQRILGERVRVALGRLSAVQREAIVLAYWGGCTQSEVAALTNTPLGTVKTRTASAMRLLAGELRTR